MARTRLSGESLDEARRLYEVEGWSETTIADYFGVSQPAINTYKQRYGWQKPANVTNYSQAQLRNRERAKSIQAQADRTVMERVAVTVSSRISDLVGTAREEAIVEANAMEVSRVMVLHRSGASEVRELVGRLFRELQLISVPREHLQELIEAVALAASQDEEDERASRRIQKEVLNSFRELLGLGNRASIAKSLVDSMVKMVELERKVYGIKDEADAGDVARALKELAAHD